MSTSVTRPWTAAEDDIIRAHPHTDLTELTVLLFAKGFRRTFYQVKRRRNELLPADTRPPEPPKAKPLTRAQELAALERSRHPPAIKALVWEVERETGMMRQLGPHASARQVASTTHLYQKLSPSTVVCGRGHIWPKIHFSPGHVTA